MVATDEHTGYRHLPKIGFRREHVSLHKYRYVVGTTHTNTIEIYWSLIKRGIIDSYHHVSDVYLPRYLDEFDFRFNNRKEPAMFEKMLQNCGALAAQISPR